MSRKQRGTSASYDELVQALVLDKDELDDANLQQPQLYYEVADKVSRYTELRDKKKKEYDDAVVAADRRIRAQMAKTDNKTTETQIKNMISDDKEVSQAASDLLGAKAVLDKWTALKESYEQRARSLKNLTELYNGNYFTVSTGSASRREISERGADEARVAMARKRKKAGYG